VIPYFDARRQYLPHFSAQKSPEKWDFRRNSPDQAIRRRGTFAAISSNAASETASKISESADAGK
jgi:hypothetical protein